MELSVFEGLPQTVAGLAVTGVLAFPYWVGMKDPEDYPNLARVWMIAGGLVAIACGAFSLGGMHALGSVREQFFGYAKLMDMKSFVDPPWISRFGAIAVAAAVQSLALLIFEVIYIDPKLRKQRRDKD